MKRIAVASIAAVAIGIVAIGACSEQSAPPLPTESSDASTVTGDTITGDTITGDTIAGDTGASSTTVATTATTTVAPTTTTLPPLVTDRAVVLVANAADVPGAAGRLTAALERAGYATNPATDAAGWEIRLDTSKVYYLPKAKKAARSLAQRMGVETYPMPVPVPIVGAYEFFGNTTVLIMLGKDLADRPIPGIFP